MAPEDSCQQGQSQTLLIQLEAAVFKLLAEGPVGDDYQPEPKIPAAELAKQLKEVKTEVEAVSDRTVGLVRERGSSSDTQSDTGRCEGDAAEETATAGIVRR